MTTTHEVGGTNWSLRAGEGWIRRRDGDGITLVATPEIGALQISASTGSTDVTDADLRELAGGHLKAGAKPRDVVLGDFAGFAIAFGVDTSFCRQWYVRWRRQMLFVTYTCGESQQGLEDAAVHAMLATLAAKRPTDA